MSANRVERPALGPRVVLRLIGSRDFGADVERRGMGSDCGDGRSPASRSWPLPSGCP